ncbi:hypothetical protein TSACC_21053 [Terrimicrobium sacchariphilum]|uniref:Fructose-bisphosphate aldolase, class I n=1 Tax=Terrimicrobium sacchariphilum TaxID=690879 RepID=A0A146G6U3_TERSA|nr:hypothetical protein [Terrimicrobium sacchariphilum]GAT32654.1 hypothetical protein TSACC_21053 [Terrimicrobium sacchariphilum]
MSTPKRLDEKLARIRAGRATAADFIIADAKDADMAFGITAPGPEESKFNQSESQGRWKTLADYRQQIRDVISQGLVDIVLLSASNLEQLAIRERLFEDSPITPAARANDTTDIWVVRGGKYASHPSRAFHTASIEHIKYGRMQTNCTQPYLGADLGLYSITFTNNIDWDYQSLLEFASFRGDAERKGFRYFLEVFNPNIDPGIDPRQIGPFLNDHIVRMLAGVTSVGRPLFLKIPYNGPAPLEELVSYDPSLIVGILGGSAGTTLDAFQLIHDARKHGAWVALFGRKINLSEHPLTFIKHLRHIVDGELSPKEAVRSYHAELKSLGIASHRPLEDDLNLTNGGKSYSN